FLIDFLRRRRSSSSSRSSIAGVRADKFVNPKEPFSNTNHDQQSGSQREFYRMYALNSHLY
ncbi:Hypothetical protein CINCED_3A006554, partial [Cinara cedri]